MSRKPWGVVTDQGRAVRRDVLGEYAVKSGEESRQPAEQLAFTGESGLLTPRYDPVRLAGLVDLNVAHARACQQKATDTAGGGWRWDRAEDDAPEEDRDRVKGFFDNLPAPENALDDDDLGDVFTAAQLDFETTGRGVLELVREDYNPKAPLATLAHMPSHEVRIHSDKRRFLQIRHGVRRWFKWVGAPIDVDYESGEVRELGELDGDRRASEILWWRQYHPLDKVYGAPDVLPALGAIHGDTARRDYNIEFFSNFGVPAYAIFVTGDYDPGDMVDNKGNVVEDDSPDAVMTELEWHIDSLLDKVRKNPHSSLIFTIPTREDSADGEVKIHFEPLATEMKEASFRLYRRDNREEILSAHGMSAAVAGVFDQGVANRESMAHYKRSVVDPRRRRLEGAVNRYIVDHAFGVKGWRFRLVGLDVSDLQKDLEVWFALLDRGGVTLRQLLRHFHARLGMPDPGPDGDDPVLDARRVAAQYADASERAGDGPSSDPVAEALRAMRDDMVGLALKAEGLRA